MANSLIIASDTNYSLLCIGSCYSNLLCMKSINCEIIHFYGRSPPSSQNKYEPLVGLTPMRGERFPPVGVNNFLRPM